MAIATPLDQSLYIATWENFGGVNLWQIDSDNARSLVDSHTVLISIDREIFLATIHNSLKFSPSNIFPHKEFLPCLSCTCDFQLLHVSGA